jgi:hypothetical protein
MGPGLRSFFIQVRRPRLIAALLTFLLVPLITMNACERFAANEKFAIGEYGSVLLTENPNKLDGVSLYSAKCSVCHGDLANSQHKFATINMISQAVANNPFMGILKGNINSDQIAAISWALSGNEPVAANRRELFNCAPDRPPGNSEQRRLTRFELVNTLGDLLGTQVTQKLAPQISGIPGDSQLAGYDNIDHTASGDHIDAYYALASGAADTITADPALLSQLAGTCANDSPVLPACVNAFLLNFGSRALRRPLSADELTSLSALFTDAASAGGATDGGEGFRSLITYLLLSPDFIYRLETNPNRRVGSNNVFQLTAYELANRLSYLIWGTMPDATLFKNAQSGALLTGAVYANEVDRLLADPKAAANFQHFYMKWMVPPSTFGSFMYSNGFLAGINPANLQSDMATEFRDYMDTVIWKQKGGFRELMTSDMVFPRTPALAAIFATSTWADGQEPVRAPPGTRAGLMTRPFLLARGVDQGHPVLRGSFIRRRVLCGVLPAPVASSFQPGALTPPAPDGFHTSRELYTAKTQDTQCLRCHSLINPSGFALANYDALGRFQTSEKIFDLGGSLLGSPAVDASTSISLDPPIANSVSGAESFARELGESPTAKACFVTQWYEYAAGRTSGENDGCSMNDLYAALNDSGGIYQMIRATAFTPNFKNRAIQP